MTMLIKLLGITTAPQPPCCALDGSQTTCDPQTYTKFTLK